MDTKTKKTLRTLLILLAIPVCLKAFMHYGRAVWVPVYYSITGQRTVKSALYDIQFKAYNRLEPYLERVGVRYPPTGLTLIAIKDQKQLEVWFEQEKGPVFIRSYHIEAASGDSGPKLQEGDGQVPEGIYRITGLNPNSSYHLSMKIDYPSEFDRKMARQDGRDNLGGDIFIHGDRASAGCLAMGDEVIEELFLLVADAGIANVKVIIAPVDLRRTAAPLPANAPDWVPNLYNSIERELKRYKRPGFEKDKIIRSEKGRIL